MTKKSPSRLERDAKAKAAGIKPEKAKKSDKQKELEFEQMRAKSRNWDDLEELYKALSKLAVSKLIILNQLYSTPGVKEHVDADKYAETLLQMKSITKDIDSMSISLKENHDRHANRTGGFTDTDDLMESISVFEVYQDISMHYASIIEPQLNALIATATDVITRMQEAVTIAKQESDIKNVNIVTDVTFKEV